ncbi:MAG: sugar transferase, partial [Deltaproteobacteria bacterium]|nr:sugar transferase [Deltaproteobacteria bacterium]
MRSPLSFRDRFLKRSFDIVVSALGLCFTWWIISIAYILASIDTRANGFFTQKRVGKDGKLFSLIKIRTMRGDQKITTNVTTEHDPRITKLGRFFRKTKIDELAQL